MLNFLDLPQTAPTPVFEDNSACICLCNSDSHESRVKHRDIHLHNARQHVARGTVALLYVNTTSQAADFLTKAASIMARPLAVLFGSDITPWETDTKDMKLPAQRYLVPFAPLAAKIHKAVTAANRAIVRASGSVQQYQRHLHLRKRLTSLVPDSERREEKGCR